MQHFGATVKFSDTFGTQKGQKKGGAGWKRGTELR